MSTVSASIRYLAAKKGLDDRSLNRHVWDELRRAIRDRRDPHPLRVLEVGCGIGTMLERLLDWGLLTRAVYTGIDVQAEFIREARQRFHHYASAQHPGGELEASEAMALKTPRQDVRVTLEAVDLMDFLARPGFQAIFDLLVAHAFLDLVDLPTVLPRLSALLAPGGLLYYTLNFDGSTILEPTIDADLDRRIETLYHQTMDTRRRGEQLSGSSVTGRRLLLGLREMGVRVLAAGSSDWVVFPGPAGYPGDEAYFLHYLIDTIGQALAGHPGLDRRAFQAWVGQRHRQVDSQELIYVAHQLDILGYNDKKKWGYSIDSSSPKM